MQVEYTADCFGGTWFKYGLNVNVNVDLYSASSQKATLMRSSGLESPRDRLGGTHAEGAGHPDKLTVHRWRWYYAGGTHC